MSGQDTIYEMVTERMIAALEKGVVPWRKPWTTTAPTSLTTGKPYRGINVFLLAVAAQEEGYRSNWWGSKNQIHKLGGRVKDEEFRNVHLVIFWKWHRKEDESGEARSIPTLRFYWVYNADQCEGLPAKYQAQPEAEGTFAENRSAELLAKDYLAREDIPLHHGGDQAFWVEYTDGTERIQLPFQDDFDGPDEYYSALFHEITHSTGSRRRLNREDCVKYGQDIHNRAREELTAEIGSAMLQAATGIESSFDNSASYIGSWLRQLRDDKRLVVQAAARAQKAVDRILGLKYSDSDEGE